MNSPQPAEPFEWQQSGTSWHGPCIYHVTMVAHDRQPLFGKLIHTGAHAMVELSELGWVLINNLAKTKQMCPEVRFLNNQVMPDHFHLVLYVTQTSARSIRQLMRGYMQGCKAGAREKGFTDPLFDEAPFIRPLAGKNQLNAMITYVSDNPRRAWIKRENPTLFRIRRDTQVVLEGRSYTFSSLGNHFLLDYPVRQQVQCSRSMTPEEIEAMKTEMLTASTETGAVTYSAAISEGEKQISRALRGANLPMVILLKDGFPPAGSEQERFYKPGGVFFEACAAGRLLLLEVPESMFDDEWIQEITHTALMRKAQSRGHSYTELPTSSSRFRFMALNEIGRLLVKQ